MNLAASVQAHLEEIFGDFSDATTDTANPERSWVMNITSIEEGQTGELVVLMGVASGMKQLADANARALLALTGERHPDLKKVTFINGKGEHLGEATRDQVPMLNQRFGRR